MKLEDLPPNLREAATSMQTLAGDAYATARGKFLEALAKHTGDVEKAKQQVEDVLDQARNKSGGVLDEARAKSEQLLKQAQARSDELIRKAKGKLDKK
jgi:hypothetical protein